MATFLQLKNGVANIFGRTDGGTPDTVRDNSINDVIRNLIASYYPFSWLRKTASLTIDSSGQADLPSDFNITHKISYIAETGTGNNDDKVYQEIDVSANDSFGLGDTVYYIDFNTSTNRWRVNSKIVSKTLSCVYYYIPAILVNDIDVCVVPDSDAVIYLSAARTWIGIYFDETNHDRFQTLGMRQLDLMVARDKKARPQRRRRGSIYTVDLGFNT